MEREVGGAIGMGNTCKPMAVSFQCMTKSTTNKKKKEKEKKKRQPTKWEKILASDISDVLVYKIYIYTYIIHKYITIKIYI